MKWLVVAYCLVATACLAQGVGDPSFRIIPKAPTFGTRAYMEVGVPPCRVSNSQLAVAGTGITVQLSLNGQCTAAEDSGYFVVDFGLLAQGQYVVGLRVNGGAYRETAFTVSQANGSLNVPPEVFPESPRSDSVAYISYNGCEAAPTITRGPGAEIFVQPGGPIFCAVPPVALKPLGLLRPGHYVVFTRYNGIVYGSKRIVVTSGFGKLDYTDLWESPSESGWGMSIVQHDLDRVFVIVYSYRADGRPLWLALTGGSWESPTRFFGEVYRVSGPSAAATFNPGAVSSSLVGFLRVEFDSPQTGTATFSGEHSPPGLPATKTWRIARVPF
jgi:hypothetical protein